MKRSHMRCRELLILLGFVSQGFATERLWVLALFVLLWGAARARPRPRRWLHEDLEAAMLAVALVVGYSLAPRLGIIWFAGLANALVLFQLLRLTWEQQARERLYTVAVAVTQIAVGAQAVFDYRFAAILAGILVLLPATLFELECERFGETPRWRAALPRPRHLAILGLAAIGFFLLFPRPRLAPAITGFGLMRGAQNRELDMSSGGQDVGDRLVLRIEGDDLGYLRALTLDRYDGRRWSADRRGYQPRRYPVGQISGDARRRVVKVAAPAVLQHALPTDGVVERLVSSSRQRPYIAVHGGVMTPLPLSRGRPLTYEYWSRPGPAREPLTDAERRRYLSGPPLSQAVAAWLHETVGKETAGPGIAARLVDRLRRDFHYRVGAPSLNDTAPLEQFLLEERQGHCERFAGALAALLRASGIPSRVAIGYLPVERNALGGFHNVRTRHAHAWTEAWFPEVGWTTLDATPAGLAMPVERQRLAFTLLEWIEYVWYARIVEFGPTEQGRLLGGGSQVIRTMLNGLWASRRWLAASLGILVIVGAVLRRWRNWQPRRRAPAGAAATARRAARHFYGRMLQLLARQHYPRAGHQTPFEFLDELERTGYPQTAAVRLITETFCTVYYGGAELSQGADQAVREALIRVAREPRCRQP